MARRPKVPKLAPNADTPAIVGAVNDLRQGFLAWVVEQNHRDMAEDARFGALEETVTKALKDHAAQAQDTIAGLSERVTAIELLPRRVLRVAWGILVGVGVSMAANIGSNFFLHQQSQHHIDVAVASAQQAAATSTKTATSVTALTNAVATGTASNASTP